MDANEGSSFTEADGVFIDLVVAVVGLGVVVGVTAVEVNAVVVVVTAVEVAAVVSDATVDVVGGKLVESVYSPSAFGVWSSLSRMVVLSYPTLT